MMGNSITTCSKHSEPETYHCETCKSSIRSCLKCLEETHEGHVFLEENDRPVAAATTEPEENTHSNNSEVKAHYLLEGHDTQSDQPSGDEDSRVFLDELQKENSILEAISDEEVPSALKSAEINNMVSYLENGDDTTSCLQQEVVQESNDQAKQKMDEVADSSCVPTMEPEEESQTPPANPNPLTAAPGSRLQAHFSSEVKTDKSDPPTLPKRSPLFGNRPKMPKTAPSKPTKTVPAAAPTPSPSPRVSYKATDTAATAYKSDSDLSSAVCPEPVMTTRHQTTSPSLHRSSTPQLVWWEYFGHLLQWGSTHADYNVPAGSLITLEDGSSQDLGLWLRRQKSYLNKMQDDKYDALIQLAETGKLWGGDANDLHAAASADEAVEAGGGEGVKKPLGATTGGGRGRQKRKAGEAEKKEGGRAEKTSPLARELKNLLESDSSMGEKRAKTSSDVSRGGLTSPRETVIDKGIGPNKGQRRIQGRVDGLAGTLAAVAAGHSSSSTGVVAAGPRWAVKDRDGSASAAAAGGRSKPLDGASASASLIRSGHRLLTESDREGFRSAADETSDSQQQQYRRYSQHHSHHSHHHSSSHYGSDPHSARRHHSDDDNEDDGRYHYVAFAYASSDMPTANEIQIGVGCVEYTPNHEGNEVLIKLKAMLTPVDRKHFLDGLFMSEDQMGDVFIDKDAIVAKHIKVKRDEGKDDDLFYLTERSQKKIRETHVYHRLFERKF